MAFSLNRLFISIFVFLGTFSILLMFMPTEFYQNLTGYSGASAQDKEVVSYFDAHGMTVYNQTLALDNETNPFLEYGSSQSFDYGLPEGQKLEFWWDVEYGRPMFEIRHTNPGLFGWWTEHHSLIIQEPYKSQAGLGDIPSPLGLEKQHLVNLWNEDYNACYAEWKCNHILLKAFVFPYNETKTIGESWDDGYLGIYTSYNINWDAIKPSAWSLLTSLLLFQAPELGLEGMGGSILSYLIGLVLWSSIAILAFAILTSLIPFISGWGD